MKSTPVWLATLPEATQLMQPADALIETYQVMSVFWQYGDFPKNGLYFGSIQVCRHMANS